MRRPWAAWGLAAFLTVAAAHQAARGWQRLEASRSVWRAQKATAEMIAREAPPLAAVVESHLEALGKARARDPLSVGAIAAQGDLLLVAGRLEPAAAAYRQGLRLEPRPELYLNLGLALWSLDRDEEALVAFGKSVALDSRLRGRVPPEARDRLSTGEALSPRFAP